MYVKFDKHIQCSSKVITDHGHNYSDYSADARVVNY